MGASMKVSMIIRSGPQAAPTSHISRYISWHSSSVTGPKGSRAWNSGPKSSATLTLSSASGCLAFHASAAAFARETPARITCTGSPSSFSMAGLFAVKVLVYMMREPASI